MAYKPFHMIDLKKLRKEVAKYDKVNNVSKAEMYINKRARLVKLVNRYTAEPVAVATGFNINTVRQHFRNTTGTALISSRRLDRAEYVLSKM
jgi:hypothetical protein